MTDAEVITKLAARAGGMDPLADGLQTTRQTLSAWKRKGIPRHVRLAVAAYAKSARVRLPAGFVTESRTARSNGAQAAP